MNSLAGSDLVPLPHESTQSLLLRLMHWNRMQWADLACVGIVLSRRRGAPVELSQAGARCLHELTGWRVDAREAWLVDRLRHTHMIAPGFRFCARCLAGGYHSYFYQLTCVAECPLHQEALWHQCPCCGAPLGPASRGRSLPPHAYLCVCCGRPLGLGVPAAETFLALREHASVMRAALLPYWLWVKRVVAKRRVLPALFQPDFGRPVRSALATCQASVLCAVVPADCIRPTIPLTTLSWRLRCRPGASRQVRHPARFVLVYRATLRNLQRWISTLSVRGGLMSASPSPSSEPAGEERAGGRVNVTAVHAARAYQLLRHAVEHVRDDLPVCHDLAEATPAWDFQIAEPSLRDLPRLPTRAIFLAMFAESYLRSQGRSDFSPTTEGVRTDAELVLCSGITEDVRWGFLCFPGLPGLPTRPFTRVERGISAALLSLARPEPFIRSQRGSHASDRC